MDSPKLMKLWRLSKLKWVGGICFIGGIFAATIYQYDSQLWILSAKLWHILQDHHRLKDLISSFGVFSPLAFILFQVIRVVVAPIPGEANERMDAE